MTDHKSALPVRSEADGLDERVQVKIVDKTNPDTQQVTVDTDSNLHVEGHGNDPSGIDRVIRTSEQGHTAVSGIYDVSINTDPSNIALVAHTRNGSPADTQSTERLTSIEDSGGTVRALDISLHDEDGEAYNATNPLPVTIEESEGDEIHDYHLHDGTGTGVAKDGTSVHSYVIADGTSFLLRQILSRSSGQHKCLVEIGDGAETEVFTTLTAAWASTATNEADTELMVPKVLTGTVDGLTIRITVTNTDQQPQDIHTTIVGVLRT